MENEEIKLRYNKLAGLVREMLATQQLYFKSNKDFQLLKKSKALEAQVNDIVNPKPTSQAQIDWLGQ